MEGWITVDQACTEIGYTASYIRRLAREGRIEAQHYGSEQRGMWLINPESLRTFKAKMDAAGASKHGQRRE
jgi:excisionase family DNA binding protein